MRLCEDLNHANRFRSNSPSMRKRRGGTANSAGVASLRRVVVSPLLTGPSRPSPSRSHSTCPLPSLVSARLRYARSAHRGFTYILTHDSSEQSGYYRQGLHRNMSDSETGQSRRTSSCEAHRERLVVNDAPLHKQRLHLCQQPGE